jgi:ATP-binding cassette, sub-family E, member 1
MRIAVIDRERCKVRTCGLVCKKCCPMVKTGKETIVEDEESGKPIIVEDMCSGCGICTKKCPHDAIQIINIVEEVGEPIHQYGANGFRLYNLPTPKEGVVGIVGANGIGKTTMMKILSGELKPNLGMEHAEWGEVVARFRGKEIQNYLEKLSRKEMKAVYKPQHVDKIPIHVKGKVRDVLEKSDTSGRMKDIVEKLDLTNALGGEMKELSGGELQRVALTACLAREADVYLIDEPSSYLDVRERINMAKVIREIAEQTKKYVFVIEHDLIVLDYLSDYVHVIYGASGAYGVISNIKSTRVGINEYLGGYLKSENVRFREEIKFDVRPPKDKKEIKERIEYPELKKHYDRFKLDVDGGVIEGPEMLGILGKNAIGKTTFVKMLAGVIEPDKCKLDLNLKVSYKPQYIEPQDALVVSLHPNPELVERFRIRHLMDRNINDLSGGELQKVAIVDCLSKSADLYLLDEPSAYLDVEERLKLSKHLKKFIEDNRKSILVVDHDIMLIDYLSDQLMVFSGEGGKHGHATAPMDLRSGMNKFLKDMNTTFRRDAETKRPRINKPDSVKDREQRNSGQYYYVE